MSRIQLTDSSMSAVAKMSDGNPGAMTALLDIMTESPRIDPQAFGGEIGPILSLDTHGIYGTDIYVLHSDICKKETSKTLAVLRAVQLGFLKESILKDACSRQDYSGCEMIDVNDLYEKVKAELKDFDN